MGILGIWIEICPDSGQYPIDFNQEELAQHTHEEES